ncbi:MAG: diguanylate cyclase [Planctomycetota bacterium]
MIPEEFEELKHTGQLPTPAGVGMKLLMLTQNENYLLDDVVRTIQADSALTGRIIKLATSVQLTGATRIGTVREAAMRLGMRTVTNVALGFTLVSGNRSGRCEGFDYDHYWSWSLACAVAAETFSRELGLGIPAEAFTCALLSKVGRLALASVHPTEYTDVILRCESDPSVELVEVEKEHFRINHREVAAAMLEDWGLPVAFCEAVLHCGAGTGDLEVYSQESVELLRLLNGACTVANVCLAAVDEQPAHWESLGDLAATLQIESATLRRIFETIVPAWREWGELLEVPTNEVAPFPAIAGPALGGAAGAAKPAPSKGGKDCLRILAVDDDPVSLRLLVRHLALAGHEVITATNGKQALALALQENPQIVVTDWMMPEMDGIQLCRTLRRFGSGRNLYILILTGRAEEDRVVEAFEAGVDDYIVKPFKPKLLLARIRGGQRVVHLQERVEQDKRTQREQVGKLAVMARKLKDAALTDALTELNNRRYAMKRLEMEWANSTRSGAPFSVIMLDIDNFKAVNDSHGHDVGDTVLHRTAMAIKRSLRRGDTPARIGGEEFLVLCPHTNAEGAGHVAERIRQAVEENAIETDSLDLHVTVSLGVATREAGIDSVSTLLKAADEAVYDAKRAGRNRVAMGRPPRDKRQRA